MYQSFIKKLLFTMGVFLLITSCNRQNINNKSEQKQQQEETLDDLYIAIREGNLQKVKKEIEEEGKNPNKILEVVYNGENVVKNFNENSLLHIASEWGQKEVVKYLLEQGADINIRDSTERTPLHEAVTPTVEVRSNLETINFLIEAGANVNATDTTGITPLHQASKYKDLEEVKILIEAGANVNARTSTFEETPLHKASRAHMYYDNPELIKSNPSVKVVKTLIEAGAETKVKDSNNCTPYHVAKYNKKTSDIRKVLDKYGGELIYRESNIPC